MSDDSTVYLFARYQTPEELQDAVRRLKCLTVTRGDSFCFEEAIQVGTLAEGVLVYGACLRGARVHLGLGYLEEAVGESLSYDLYWVDRKSGSLVGKYQGCFPVHLVCTAVALTEDAKAAMEPLLAGERRPGVWTLAEPLTIQPRSTDQPLASLDLIPAEGRPLHQPGIPSAWIPLVTLLLDALDSGLTILAQLENEHGAVVGELEVKPGASPGVRVLFDFDQQLSNVVESADDLVVYDAVADCWEKPSGGLEEVLRCEAEAGDAHSMHLMGVSLQHALDSPTPDFSGAAQWYRRSIAAAKLPADAEVKKLATRCLEKIMKKHPNLRVTGDP